MIPSTAELIRKLYPDKRTRDLLPPFSIVYMGPGGHRQWPLSIIALLNRFLLLISATKKSAIAHLAAAVKAYPELGKPTGAHIYSDNSPEKGNKWNGQILF